MQKRKSRERKMPDEWIDGILQLQDTARVLQVLF
jgi:hypothetical protein